MAPRPEFREALLRRLATDLAVVAAEGHARRPAEMECCAVFYEKPWPPVPGRTTTFVDFICENGADRQGSGHCPHVHHKGDVFLA